MSVIIHNIVPISFTPGGFLGKLAAATSRCIGVPQDSGGENNPLPSLAPPELAAGGASAGAASLTPAALRAALLELGANAGAGNMALAQSLTQMGLPLTAAMLAEAGGALARAPGSSPSSFALAKSLNLAPTPAILHALSAVTEGIPASRALPDEISAWLGLHLDMSETDTDTQAAHLHLMVNARAHSVEHRLLSETGGNPFHDARVLLLRLAQNSGDRQTQQGADTLAAHMEGQQLVNGAALRTDSRTPLYFALPMSLPGENTMLELKLWPQDDTQDWENETDDADVLRAVVRLCTTKLGRVQIELSGTLAGQLTCRVGLEKPAAVRLFTRNREQLSAALVGMGWPSCAVSCAAQLEWPPLWHGGQQLAAPRQRVDWRA